MHYDGKSKLADAIADLYGYSPRNHNKIAELIQQAKTGLGITGKARVMSDEIKQDIYRWLTERLNTKQTDNNQIDLFQAVDERIDHLHQRDLPSNNPVQIAKPDNAIQHVKQATRRHDGMTATTA